MIVPYKACPTSTNIQVLFPAVVLKALCWSPGCHSHCVPLLGWLWRLGVEAGWQSDLPASLANGVKNMLPGAENIESLTTLASLHTSKKSSITRLVLLPVAFWCGGPLATELRAVPAPADHHYTGVDTGAVSCGGAPLTPSLMRCHAVIPSFVFLVACLCIRWCRACDLALWWGFPGATVSSPASQSGASRHRWLEPGQPQEKV